MKTILLVIVAIMLAHVCDKLDQICRLMKLNK